MIRALLVAALLAGCGGDTASTDDATDWVATYGGAADVYSQMAASRDCDYLQDEFDTASAGNDTAEPGSAKHKWTLGYMTAADDRMREVGCY